jgi:ADP-ribose pyrophosphatase YjhB (NUDIX family)
MQSKKISLKDAKTEKLFYFVANVIVYRESDGRCLILKRDKREKVHPGKYAVPGGKLEWGDLDIRHPSRINGDVLDFENAVEKLLEREVMEEAGIKIYLELKYINNVAFIRPDGIPVVLVKFAAKYKSGKIILEKGSFTDFVWVNTEEVKKYKCIKGIKEEIKKTIELFNRVSAPLF